MAKASLTLHNGTLVTIEGTTLEVHQLLALYGPAKNTPPSQPRKVSVASTAPENVSPPTGEPQPSKGVDLVAIVNSIKSCDEAESIEKNILDKPSRLPPVLLPMYVVYEYLSNAFGLTSGDISKVTTELGIPVAVSSASMTLSGPASKYVIGDRVRKSGQPVRYKLSRRGHAFMKDILAARAQ